MSALFIPFGYPGYPEKEMLQHIEDSKRFLNSIGIDFVSTNNVILPEDCEEAIRFCEKRSFDYVVLLLATWIEVPNMLGVLSASGLEGKPMILWAHENVYDPQEQAMISFGSIAAAGVLRETFEEFEYRFKFVLGNPGNESLAKELQTFHRAAMATARLKRARVGLFGYVSMGMYTGLADHIKVKKLLGTEIVHVEQFAIVDRLENVERESVERQEAKLKSEWDISTDIEEQLVDKTARMVLRLKDLAKKHRLDALTVKCQYELSVEYGFTPCVALSLLGEEMPVSCEGDVYLLLSQLILNYVSGKTTTYGDILGFLDDGIVCAACGFAPKCFLVPEKPCIHKHSSLYSGLLITSSFKAEEVTVIRLANKKGGFKMHIIGGHTEELKDFHEIGCPQYAGSVIRFDQKDIQSFKQEIMSQHYAIVAGNCQQELKDFCMLTGITVV